MFNCFTKYGTLNLLAILCTNFRTSSSFIIAYFVQQLDNDSSHNQWNNYENIVFTFYFVQSIIYNEKDKHMGTNLLHNSC